ncbi:MAG TPA: NUDIX domain-containing protein [Chloroflexota bacterium]|nr:NUDIX domain-containing protein [Chloroflexota bacterium]
MTRFEDILGRLSTRADDYVNALVLNESGEVLILPAPDPHSGRVAWELVGGGVEPGEDPLTAVQRILQTHTGCVTNDWTYLSSYLTDLGCHVGVGHFFCAQKARQTVLPSAQTAASPIRAPQWIPLKELRYALLDGRVASISHAATISLALLTILK